MTFLMRQVHCYNTRTDMDQSINQGHDDDMPSIVAGIEASRNPTELEDHAPLVLREGFECQLAGYE